MKATAIAPSNIAFIKYWGKTDETLRLPANGSISMNLSNLTTTTTVAFSPEYPQDSLLIDNRNDANEEKRVIAHLDRIREKKGISYKAKVVSMNNFPASTGLSSSASGFAALTVAAAQAAGLKLSEKELSILARRASGSACRSIPSGFVEWKKGDTSETSYATSLYPSDYWDIVDIVVVVSSEKKEISTTKGQTSSTSSPFFPIRLSHMEEKIKKIKIYLATKDFRAFGELIESEALEMHAVMMTSTPPLLYWLPNTVRMMKLVYTWRTEGIPVYFTLNTGQNVHLICQKKDISLLTKKLEEVQEIKQVIINTPAQEARIIDTHLF